VHDNFRHEAEEDEFEQAQSKSEASPIMSVLQDLQAVAIELDLAIKIHIVESLHGDFVSPTVFGLIGFVLESKVVLDGASGKSGLFVLARSEHRMKLPERDEDRDGGKEAEEDGGLQSAANLPRHVEWDESEDGEEEDIRESFSSGGICWNWSIFDCWVLRSMSAAFN
jgi:hypothetical protein